MPTIGAPLRQASDLIHSMATLARIHDNTSKSPATRATLSTRYRNALRHHLDKNSTGTIDHAQSLGRSALRLGLLTRDLVRIHERALVTLTSTNTATTACPATTKAAGHFIAQALIPLESAQRAITKTALLLQQRNHILNLHAAALAKSNHRLEREILRRKAVELELTNGRARYQKLFRESLLMQGKFRLLTRKIITAQEEERKEISRELHDEVVQILVGINVELASLGQDSSTKNHLLKLKIARTQRLVENSVNAVHRFARDLRPAVLDDLGLIPALLSYIKNLAAQKKIKIHLTAFAQVETLAENKRTILFRVAQEALTNVVRHAEAHHVQLTITKHEHHVRMEIRDDGKSFHAEKALLAKKRLGLIGMKERIEMIGGTLSIESKPGFGTCVCAEIPSR